MSNPGTPRRDQPRPRPAQDTRNPVDEAGDESFPASDPPSWTPSHPGQPAPPEPPQKTPGKGAPGGTQAPTTR